MKDCPKCNSPMPSDELRCIRCGFQSPPKTRRGSTAGNDAQRPRGINWTNVFAVALTSNVFFLTSCTGSLFASYAAFVRMGGQYMDQGATPSDSMVIIATIPDPDKRGDVKLKHVPLRDMEKFKAENPAHSFLLPLGSGRIPIHSESSVTYKVEPAEDSKVLVETKYHQSMGGLVIARYEAADKSVRPIFTNNVQWMVPFFIGVILASVLHLIGRVLRFWVGQRHPQAH